MDIADAVRTRKSIRGFKPNPVSREVISEILTAATRCPSAVNTQPWEFTVITGDVLDNIRHENVEKLSSPAHKASNPDLPREEYGGDYRQRQVALAIQLFKLMDIAREDKDKRAEWFQRGFRYFDAPAAIILSMDESIAGTWAWFDIGSVCQTICLVALKYGLGTCIESQGVMFPEVLRQYAGIPEGKRIVMSIAIGYPDWDFPANAVNSEREDIEALTTWCGF